MTDISLLKTQADQLQRYCWYGMLALLVWMAVETLTQGLSLPAALLLWLLQALGVLVFMPGIRAGRPRSAVWFAFTLLFYLVSAVLGSFAPGLNGQLSMVESLLIIGVFVLAIRFVKIKRATQDGAL